MRRFWNYYRREKKECKCMTCWNRDVGMMQTKIQLLKVCVKDIPCSPFRFHYWQKNILNFFWSCAASMSDNVTQARKSFALCLFEVTVCKPCFVVVSTIGIAFRNIFCQRVYSTQSKNYLNEFGLRFNQIADVSNLVLLFQSYSAKTQTNLAFIQIIHHSHQSSQIKLITVFITVTTSTRRTTIAILFHEVLFQNMR